MTAGRERIQGEGDPAVSGQQIKPHGIKAAEIPVIAESLTRAFAREPFHQWMVPDAQTWAAKAPRYFRSYINMIRRDGYADTCADGSAAALWLSPDKPGGGFLSRLRVPFVLWRLAGQKFQDVWKVIPMIERHRPRDPHWYLDILGVDPARAGQGVVTALLQHGLARADESGKVVFLDTLSPENVTFYRRHGFEVTAEVVLPSGLTVWCMVRQIGGQPN
jgi:ribosomal protein S18 acetylase RimI-like enzyme